MFYQSFPDKGKQPNHVAVLPPTDGGVVNGNEPIKYDLNLQETHFPGDSSAHSLIVDRLMRLRQSEYVTWKPVNVFIGTYNVNGQLVTENLSPWLTDCAGKEPPDIYAVGFQELDLSNQAFIFDSTVREDIWATAVASALHPGAKYLEVRRVRLIGMLLLVYVRGSLQKSLGPLSFSTIGTGLLGRLGNKGGVAVSFKLLDSWICFVNCHLAAHLDELSRRNQDFRDISSLRFIHLLDSSAPSRIFDHDLIFWFGDMNYRLQHLDQKTIIDLANIRTYCLHGNYDVLVALDQLNQVRERGLAFGTFQEAPINFPPTYKYDVGSNNFVLSRAPAWCDRVMYQGEQISLQSYSSVPSICISDHKPVYATFVLQAKQIDKAAQKTAFQACIKEADRLENNLIPQAELDKFELYFENVKFNEPQIQFIIIRNIGQTDLIFEFKENRPGQTGSCAPWLTVVPNKAYLLPKGESLKIQFEVYINKTTVRYVGDNRELLDILVLHLQNGKDFFVSVNAQYVPTCFGKSLENLLNGSLNVPSGDLITWDDGSCDTIDTSSVQLPIPFQLYKLMQSIIDDGINNPQLFRDAGRQSEFAVIRDWFDSGTKGNAPGCVHSRIDALRIFLDAMPTPVVPYQYFHVFLDAADDFSQCLNVINLLPDLNRQMFMYLIGFMRHILSCKSQNGTDVNLISAAMAPILLKSGALSNGEQLSTKSIQFISQMLSN